MPLELVTKDGTAFEFRKYELPRLGPKDVRVRVTFAAPKHGTEGHIFTGSAHDRKQWDPELRLFLPREGAPRTLPEWRSVGNMIVGVVTYLGAEASRFQVGERVYGYGPIHEVHQDRELALKSAAGLTDEDAVCTDPAHVAFVAVRDGNIRIGDDVAVFGLGAIGLMAVQTARAGGARRVFAIDPSTVRRECALAHGADAAFDPISCDAALEIKLATGKSGVDVAIETSGNARALHDSIRCIRQCGTIVHVPWGPKDASALHLDEEFHLNRPTIIGSQAVWGNADRSHPLWDEPRARAVSAELFRAGLITGQEVVWPIVAFQDAPAELGSLFFSPECSIKVGVRFDGDTPA